MRARGDVQSRGHSEGTNEMAEGKLPPCNSIFILARASNTNTTFLTDMLCILIILMKHTIIIMKHTICIHAVPIWVMIVIYIITWYILLHNNTCYRLLLHNNILVTPWKRINARLCHDILTVRTSIILSSMIHTVQ